MYIYKVTWLAFLVSTIVVEIVAGMKWFASYQIVILWLNCLEMK